MRDVETTLAVPDERDKDEQSGTASLHPPQIEPERSEARVRRKSSIFEVKSLLSITVIVLFAITFVVQAFRVPSESMEKTLLAGDFLLADKVHFADGGRWWSKICPTRASVAAT